MLGTQYISIKYYNEWVARLYTIFIQSPVNKMYRLEASEFIYWEAAGQELGKGGWVVDLS